MIKTVRYYDWQSLKPTVGTAEILNSDIKFAGYSTWDSGTANVGSYLKEKFLALQRVDNYLDLDTILVINPGYGPAPIQPLVFKTKRKYKVPNFKELCEQGIIVMNDYEVSTTTAIPHNQESVVSKRVMGSVNLYDARFEKFGMQRMQAYWGFKPRPTPWGTKSFPCHYVGAWTYQTSNVPSVLLVEAQTKVIQPGDPSSFIEANRQFRGFDSVLIQRNTADANSGDLDALTALAEMPELIESIVDGLLLLKKGAVAARKREWQVTSVHKAKVRAKANIEFNRKMKFPSRKTFIKRGGDPKDYDKFRETFLHTSKKDRENYLNQRVSNFNRKELRDLGDAISGVWLNFRYNISPTVYMIEDAIKAYERFGSIYRTTRSMNAPVHELIIPDGCTFDGSYEVVDRVTTKRQYQNEGANDYLRQALSFDILVTALERVPLWGIVVNWFVTAADFLRALNWTPKHKQSVTCFSQKIKIRGRLVFGESDRTDPYWDVNSTAYYRKIIDPADHLGIHLNLNITTVRKIDALAFFWSRSDKKYLMR